MKIIAYFLPQFHQVKENDEWWGENFTEWTNTIKMTPLFKGHDQPKEPLDDYYYNLLDRKTMEWQSEIADKYQIYGFCYYHYWFSGDKILEKPAENLLKWIDIKQNFCFCWANHDWKKSVNGNMEILKKQTYGREEEWEAHFQYLIDFFKDERYIKIKGKPVFVLYDTAAIEFYNERIAYYNKRCVDCGFDGIYIIESLNQKKAVKVSDESQAVVLREPAIAFTSIGQVERVKNIIKRRILKIPVTYSFEDIYKSIIKQNRTIRSGDCIYLGTFTDWDNTPRHGKQGSLITRRTPELFLKYLRIQKSIMKEKEIDYIFINAWNEWAEGMYLEPDKRNQYAYLEVIKKTVEEQ